MRCCEAMLYILQMAPEFPVKPRVDSCNSPLLGHQMPPEAVFPPGPWEVPDFDTLTSFSLPHLLKLFMGALAWFSSRWLLDRQKTATASNLCSISQSAAANVACKTWSKSSTLGS